MDLPTPLRPTMATFGPDRNQIDISKQPIVTLAQRSVLNLQHEYLRKSWGKVPVRERLRLGLSLLLVTSLAGIRSWSGQRHGRKPSFDRGVCVFCDPAHQHVPSLKFFACRAIVLHLHHTLAVVARVSGIR